MRFPLRVSPIIVTLYVTHVLAIGLSITPVAVGDKKHASSTKNLINCISYTATNDDLIMVHLYSGNRLTSQQLDVHVFDSEDNILRTVRDLSGEQTVMFTNLNNPIQVDQHDSKNLLQLAGRMLSKDSQKNLNIEKSQIHICFDNIYFDKSWSFQKKARDVNINVNIRNITSLKQTNYNKFAKYFNHLPDSQEINPNTDTEFNLDFTENEFDRAVSKLQTLLNEVHEELKASEGALKTLQTLEGELRNVNESIFESYTRTSLILIFVTCLFGVAQLIYFKVFFKRKKLI